jgi:hypothetical protein
MNKMVVYFYIFGVSMKHRVKTRKVAPMLSHQSEILTLKPGFMVEKVVMEIDKGEWWVTSNGGDEDNKGVVLRAKTIKYDCDKIIVRIGGANERQFVSKTVHNHCL